MSPQAERRPPQRPSVTQSPSIIVDLRLAVVVALEAIEAGDYAYAVDVLLGALEDGPQERSYRCECGWSGEWPGLLDAHRFAAHDIEAAA